MSRILGKPEDGRYRELRRRWRTPTVRSCDDYRRYQREVSVFVRLPPRRHAAS